MSDLEQFKRDVAKDYGVTDEQRKDCREDMRFINVPGGMWEDWLTHAYGDNSPRAKMEFDIVSDSVYRFVGEYVLNRASATFEAADEKTSDDDAELLNGLHRADFRDNDGQVAQDLAVLEMAQCGVGAFKFSTRFEDEGDPENDNQDTIWEPLFNAHNQVIWDSNAKRADKADARRCTILTGFSKDAFESEWPDADATSAFTPDKTDGFDWCVKAEIYVAERYEVRKEKRIVEVYENIELNRVEVYDKEEVALIKDELNELGWQKVRERRLTRQFVEKTVFTGSDILQAPKKIAGQWIPIIPIYGYRTYIDGKEYTRGLVRKLKDTNRLINMGASRMAESSASSGDTVPILTDDQVDGKQHLWADKTNKPYMLINDLEDVNGNRIPSQPVGYLQPNQLDPNTLAVTEFASNFAKNATGSVPLEGVNAESSGRAVQEFRKVENLNTQILRDNIEKSIEHSGRVYQSIQAEIQTNRRVKRAMSEDGTTSLVRLNQSLFDRESGREVIANDLSKGRFAVNVKASPQYETQKEATLESIERIMERVGNTEYFIPLLAMWMSNISGTGLEPLKNFNRQQMLKLGLVKPETEEEQQILINLSEQSDPNADLARAAAQQQLAEAANLKAATVDKIASAKKKEAETEEILQSLNGVQRLKFDPMTGQLSADS